MLLSTIDIIPPTGSTITLGALTVAADGSMSGYTLEQCVFDPAPQILVKRALPAVTGGAVLPQRRDSRQITMAGTIVAPDRATAHQLRRGLIAAFGDFGTTPIAVRFTPESTMVELRGFTDGNPKFADLGGTYIGFEVSLTCPDPVAHSVTTTSVSVPVGTGNVVASNAGDGEVWPTVTVTVPAASTLTAFTLTSETAGRMFAVAGLNLGAGDTLTVDMTAGRETVTATVGGVSTSAMGLRTDTSKFFAIKPGSNTLSATATVTGALPAVAVSYQDGWVS